jgi:hypothetical protein
MSNPANATIVDVTTVSDTEAIVHITPGDGHPVMVRRIADLPPDTDTFIEIPDPSDGTVYHGE